MRPRLLLIAIIACLAVPALAGPAAAVPTTKFKKFPNGPAIGISDNRSATLVDRRFLATHIKRARILVPYDDVSLGGGRRQRLDAWFQNAQATGVEPLVSFYRSYRHGKRHLPTVRQFRTYFRRFRKRYPQVRLFTTWNEANFPAAQPTGRNPVRTAQFYRMLRHECRGGRCTVLTADFRADGGAYSARWLRTFKRHIGRGPHIWGLVSHPDVNRFSTTRTRWFLRHTRGSVWATEIGAVNFFGKGLRPNLKRQTRAMRFLVGRYPRVSKRLKRMYIYHWRAARGNHQWDSALLNAKGGRRPSYFLFFRALGRRAP
jgi:hypothetical protein